MPRTSEKPPPRRSAAAVFREAIAKATEDGVDKPDMTLRLTLRDETSLRRDREVLLEEIKFSGGVMHFLDVKVVAGGVMESALETGG